MIECVPNFSEGRDSAVIEGLVGAIAGVPGVGILHQTSDPDHNRTVITFAGEADAVVEASIRAAAQAGRSIDLNRHRGVHPRLGALDVLPFVPLRETPLEQCVELAHHAGQRIWSELGIPVYFYEAAALRPERARLENVRRAGFEALRVEALHETALAGPSQQPDVGGPALHPTAGATIVGARNLLVAFNINLRSNDLAVARHIARRIRASNAGFAGVKALGLPLESRGLVQVSMNITSFEQAPLPLVHAEVARLAREMGVELAESELVGLIPRDALKGTSPEALGLAAFDPQRILENRLDAVFQRPL
jgi:glutamate formiminotransferase